MDDFDQLEKTHTDAAWSNFEERGDLSKDIAALLDAVPGLIAELRTLRARVAELEKDARFGAKVRAALVSFGVDRNDARYMATKSRQAPLASAVFEAIDDALREEEAGND